MRFSIFLAFNSLKYIDYKHSDPCVYPYTKSVLGTAVLVNPVFGLGITKVFANIVRLHPFLVFK